MWTRSLLKKNAKVAFHRNYLSCVLVCLLTAFLGGGVVTYSFNMNIGEKENAYAFSSYEEMYAEIMRMVEQIPRTLWMVVMMAALLGVVIGIALALLVSNVVTVGCNRYFLENREHQTDILKVFYNFQGRRYSSTVWVMFLRTLYILGWSLLLWIPGIIKSYSYMLVPYILAENTYLDRRRVFALSREMMRGHKWEAFVLNLSFLGWHILSGISGGIVGTFYVAPYVNATYAEFYSAIKAEAQMRGIFMPNELPGMGEPEII